MKKIFLVCILLGLVLLSNSQTLPGPGQSVQADLLAKSKRQLNTGIILISGGSALFITGLVVYPKDYDWLFGTTPEKDGQANTASVLVLAGLVSAAASIPFFISSSVTKRKAKNSSSLGFKMEKTTVLNQQSFSRRSFPALSLKIPL